MLAAMVDPNPQNVGIHGVIIKTTAPRISPHGVAGAVNRKPTNTMMVMSIYAMTGPPGVGAANHSAKLPVSVVGGASAAGVAGAAGKLRAENVRVTRAPSRRSQSRDGMGGASVRLSTPRAATNPPMTKRRVSIPPSYSTTSSSCSRAASSAHSPASAAVSVQVPSAPSTMLATPRCWPSLNSGPGNVGPLTSEP